MANISVIGGGSWGTALAQLLLDNGHDVIVRDNNKHNVDNINNNHTIDVLEDVILHKGMKATTSIKEVIDFADFIVISVPTKVMRNALNEVKDVLTTPKVFINASKGIEPVTFKRVSEIVEEVIPNEYLKGFVSISGPSHAEEVVLRKLTSIVSTSVDYKLAKEVQTIFHNKNYFRVYTSTDIIGAEMGASLKNVIALASGILTGLGYGDNARAALITRGLVEMNRLSVAVGAESKTLLGLTGIGDLIVTCTSLHSRNFQAGFKIGSGTNLEETLNSMTMVVEGARSAKAAYDLAKELDIEIPIIEATYDIIYNHISPNESISKLMNRDLKAE
ncbi:NAD(P)H-dependent glycerol-3-phosphate dehydrogenase [Mycoplasmatota bacterium]|nr:NAD(P)H-dependent glycerol-3-phosphate dehydrogenase [Mycoplasmatota bacterium]